MVHGTIAAVEWKNGGELARVVSGRVGWTPFFTWRSTVTNAPFTLHFVLPYDRLAQAMLSLNKPTYVNKCYYYRYFLRVSSGASYYERGIES